MWFGIPSTALDAGARVPVTVELSGTSTVERQHVAAPRLPRIVGIVLVQLPVAGAS